jgi:hypothetical protein
MAVGWYGKRINGSVALRVRILPSGDVIQVTDALLHNLITPVIRWATC